MKLAYLLLLFPLASHAVDGVLEINQACIDSGCFNGDSPGLPVTLAHTGSYRFTSNVNVSGYSTPENRNAIEISGSNVTLDLNGFAIIGPATCTGLPTTSCTPTGTGYGINISGLARGAAISNGYIQGMGGEGIVCAYDCRISHMVVINNGGNGISTAQQGIVNECIANRNLGNGFDVTGLISNSLAIGNGQLGVQCVSCSILNSMMRVNGTYGISFLSNSTYGGNVLELNGTANIAGTALATAPNRCGASACP